MGQGFYGLSHPQPVLKMTHQYLYQKLSLTHSGNLLGCLHHSVLPFL